MASSTVPAKIVMKGTSQMSLHERFSQLPLVRAPPPQQIVRVREAGSLRSDGLYSGRRHSTSEANKKLIRQLEQQPNIMDALKMRKNRSVLQRLGAKARLGNFPIAYQPYIFKRPVFTRYGRGRAGFNRGRAGFGRGVGGYGFGFGFNRGRAGFGRGFQSRRRNFGSPLQPRSGNFRGSFPSRYRRGGGFRRGRGGMRGRMERLSKEELDKQIDDYMSHTKGGLDAELDEYMNEVKTEA